MTHDLHLFPLNALHFGSDPPWKGVEGNHYHHANDGTPSEHLVQEHNAQNDLKGQRNEQHWEIPTVDDVVEISRHKICNLSDEVGVLPCFLLLSLFLILALLTFLGAVAVARGRGGSNGERGGGSFIRPFDRVVCSCALGDGGGIGSGRLGRWATWRRGFVRLGLHSDSKGVFEYKLSDDSLGLGKELRLYIPLAS